MGLGNKSSTLGRRVDFSYSFRSVTCYFAAVWIDGKKGSPAEGENLRKR